MPSGCVALPINQKDHAVDALAVKFYSLFWSMEYTHFADKSFMTKLQSLRSLEKLTDSFTCESSGAYLVCGSKDTNQIL